jgi:hypothetical protein
LVDGASLRSRKTAQAASSDSSFALRNIRTPQQPYTHHHIPRSFGNHLLEPNVAADLEIFAGRPAIQAQQIKGYSGHSILAFSIQVPG